MVVRLEYRKPLLFLAGLHGAAAVGTLVCERLYLLFPRSRVSYELASLINISGEGNLSSFLQSLTLGAAGVLSLCLSTSLPASPRSILVTLAALWTLMSMDEFVMVHERLTLPLRSTLHLSGALYYSWVVLGVPLVLAIGVWFLRASRQLPRNFWMPVLCGGVFFFGGSLGVEMVTGSLRERFPDHTYGQLVLCVIEESMESLGSLLWLTAVGRQLADPDPNWHGGTLESAH